MKKFTVISLLLVLVAGFAFAGLAPYSTADYSISAYGQLEDKLQTLVVDGDFVVGVVANDLVDINLDINPTWYHNYELAPNESNDYFKVLPSLNVTYAGEKLTAGASFALPMKYVAEDLIGLDHGADEVKFDADLFATYSNALRNSGNILTLSADTDFVFDKNSMDGYLYADATIDADNLSATARGFLNFESEGGLLDLEFVKGLDVAAKYLYKDIVFTGSADIANFSIANFDLYGLYGSKLDNYFVTADASAEYKWSKAVGSLKLDKYGVTASAKLATSGFKGDEFTTKATGKVVVDLPHIVPVELIPNMAFNLPATVTATAVYTVGKNIKYSFNAKAHVAYLEFAKKVSVFDETIDSLDVTFSYGNTCTYDFGFNPSAKYHDIAANVTLKLSKGAVVFGFANNTDPDAETVNAVSLSYTKSYK